MVVGASHNKPIALVLKRHLLRIRFTLAIRLPLHVDRKDDNDNSVGTAAKDS